MDEQQDDVQPTWNITSSHTRINYFAASMRGPSVQLAAASIAIITTRHLFVNGFHYPMLVLLTHLSFAIVSGLLLKRSTEQHPLWKSPIYQLLHAVFTACSLVFGYQSLLHLRNSTFCVMMLSLNWDRMVYRSCPWRLKGFGVSLEAVLKKTTFFVCVALLYLQESKLSDQRDVVLLGCMACLVVARRCWEWGLLKAEEADPRPRAIFMPLAKISAALFVFWTHDWEHIGDFGLNAERIALLLTSAVAGAIVLHGDLFTGKSTETEEPSFPLRESGLQWVACSFFLVVVTAIDNLNFRSTRTAIGQWLAFSLASLASLDVSLLLKCLGKELRYRRFSGITVVSSEDGEDPSLDSETAPCYADEAHEACFTATLAALPIYKTLNGLTWLLVLAYVLSRWSLGPAPGGQSPAVDLDHPFDLDIVIARYEEPLHLVAANMHSILRTTRISGLRTRIFLYNKSPKHLNNTHETPSFPLARELIIENRPNTGREAETYLSHILAKKEEKDLAPHTLFLQAQPHELWELQTRIEQYFISRTGFLSLSYPNSFCAACNLCGDVSGWHADQTLLETLYTASNPGEKCRDLSLTYRGQFIASAATIRKIETRVLRDARDRVLGDNGEFGYTMERLWGVVLGCPRIEARCPSLFSGLLGNRGRVEECQCLDEDEDEGVDG